MHFVLYSDSNCEYMVDYFIRSTEYAKLGMPILYYTIGFTSDLSHPNLTKIQYPIDTNKTHMVYYKPDILIDSLKYTDRGCFMDCDVIIGKRFKVEDFENGDCDHPLSCVGPEQYPYIFWRNGEEKRSFDDGALRSYFNIGDRTMAYVWASQISYNRECLDFLLEWKSICDNKYLLGKGKILGDLEYFPFREETAYNITLWKRGATQNLGLRFLNTGKFETFHTVENSDYISEQYFDNKYGLVQNSGSIGFYHGFKDRDELEKILCWMQGSAG